MADVPQPGDTVGRYTIGERLGSGGSGTVFRATRSMPRREVALKVIPTELASTPGFRNQFVHEADILSELNSPHIVSIHDVGEDDGYLFIATDLVPGGDLGTRLERGPVPLKPALTLAAQVSLALSAAHEAGIIHGDVKPSNVLLGQRDGMPHAFLCDFGISQPAGAGGTRRNVVTGTAAYLAPELVTGGGLSPASDVYALGCLLVAAITGAPPYQGTEEEIAQQHLSSEIPHWEETSPLLGQLNELIQTAMAKDPADRYPSAEAFRAAILDVLGEVPAAPAPTEPDPAAAAAAAAAVAAAAAATPAVLAAPDESAAEEPVAEEPVTEEPAAEEPAAYEQAEPVANEAAEDTQVRMTPIAEPVFAPDPQLLTPDESGWESEEQPRHNGRVLVSSVVALLVVAAAVGGIVLFQKDDEKKPGSATTTTSPTSTPAASPSASPTGTPTPGQKKICQEGREVDATKPCGQPYGIPGLKYVFSTVSGDCDEKQMNTREKYWEISCVVSGENPGTVVYSTYRTTALVRETNDELFPVTSPITLPSGLLQFGPEQQPGGSWRIGVAYPAKHPYGVLITAGSSEAAQRLADEVSEGALPSDRFVVE